MKKLILIATTLMTFAGFCFADPYEDGFKAGWAAGYRYHHSQSSDVPEIPMAPERMDGEQEGFQGGYNRGLLEGLRSG